MVKYIVANTYLVHQHIMMLKKDETDDLRNHVFYWVDYSQ